jgi:hypothetical protein
MSEVKLSDDVVNRALVIASCDEPVGAGDGDTYVMRVPTLQTMRAALEFAIRLAESPSDAEAVERERERERETNAQAAAKAVMQFRHKHDRNYYPGYHEDMRDFVAAAIRNRKDQTSADPLQRDAAYYDKLSDNFREWP